MFWGSGASKKSVLAQLGCLEKGFGVARRQEMGFNIVGLARKVLWFCRAGKKSVLVLLGWCEKCFVVARVTISPPLADFISGNHN